MCFSVHLDTLVTGTLEMQRKWDTVEHFCTACYLVSWFPWKDGSEHTLQGHKKQEHIQREQDHNVRALGDMCSLSEMQQVRWRT